MNKVWIVEVKFPNRDWQPTPAMGTTQAEGKLRKERLEYQSSMLGYNSGERPKYRVKIYERVQK